MKITVSKNEFLNKLKMVGKIVGPSKNLPLFENYMFVISDQFRITGSDNSGSITGAVNTISIDKLEGLVLKVLVDKTLVTALKELAEQPIELIINENTLHITVNYQNGVFEIQGTSAEAFPELVVTDDHVTVLLERQILIEGIKSAIPFVASDELRPVMNGIFMQYASATSSLAFVATDAHTLSVREYTGVEFPEFGSIIPLKAAKMIVDIISESKEEIINISIGTKNITITTDIYSLVYRLIDGRYPNFRAVIPKIHNSLLKVNAEDLQSTLRRVAVFANRNTLLIKFDINGGILKIDAEDIDFNVSASETIFAEYEGEPIVIGFNANKLSEIMGSVSTSECTIKFIDNQRAAIINPTGVDGVTLLIMPLLINN